MKRPWYFFFAAWGFAVYASTAPLAKEGLDLQKANQSVEFFAVGRPSAIKIHGTAKETNGEKPVRGTLKLDSLSVSGTAKIKLDAFDTGMDMRNRHMKEKYLQTQKYPEAEISIAKLSLPEGFRSPKASAEELPFEGTLTLHGTKRPISGTAKVKKEGTALTLDFSFKVPMTDYGIEPPSFMGITVKDDVAVTVHVEGPLAKID